LFPGTRGWFERICFEDAELRAGYPGQTEQQDGGADELVDRKDALIC
jgi:hypothetical protein